MKNFTLRLRALLLSAVAAAGAVWVLGCGGGDGNPAGGGGGSGGGGGVVDPNTVVGGSFTDVRDGQTYRTVKIGSQTWMAENLNYQTEESRCYGEGGGNVLINDNGALLSSGSKKLTDEEAQANCDTYGRLYSWDAAKKACPSGWKLPDSMSWERLGEASGWHGTLIDDALFHGKKLKSKSGWNDWCGLNGDGVCVSSNGTDDYGFTALPGGSYAKTCESCSGYYSSEGNQGYWWSATTEGGYDGKAYRVFLWNMNEDVADILVGGYQKMYYGFSVRCVK